MMRRLRFLSHAQWWDSHRIEQERNTLLGATLRIAYDEVPFYRQLWEEAGVRPTEIGTASDLVRLPVVTKPMLQAAYPHRATRKTSWKTYEVCTSGSTGTNFRILEDTETAGWYRATLLLVLGWAGWLLGEPHLQIGVNLQRSLSLRLKDYLLNCHYVAAAHLKDVDLDHTLERLDRYHIRHLWGFPGSIQLLARRVRQMGRTLPLQSIVTWGDNLYPHYRGEIEAAFDCRVLDMYGCSEGMIIASQCERRDLYHAHMLDVIVELLDDEDQPVPPDQPGNIVVTRLHPGPMPLIRYRVGDIGIRGRHICPCGRGFETLQAIEGRDTDYVVTPEGNRLIVHFFTGILEYFPEIAAFQVTQDEPGAITLRIVPTNAFTSQAAERILVRLRDAGAGDLAIRLELVEAIPLTPGGKRRFVINTLNSARVPH